MDSIPADLPSNTIYLHFSNQLLQNMSSLNCNQLPNLQQLNVDSNRIEEIEINDFLGCSSLQYLNIYKNNLTEIKNGTFNGLTSLTILHIHYNMLTEIEDGNFIGMASLQTLYVNNNLLTAIKNGTFNGLTSMQELSLAYNAISKLESAAFINLPSLRNLYLQNNLLTEIKNGIFNGLTSLEALYLGHNTLTEITNETLAGLTGNLRSLSLTYNELSYIEDGAFSRFQDCRTYFYLIYRYLDHNSLTDITKNILAGLTENLKTLDLSYNLLTNMEFGTLAHLTGLRYLYLSNNLLTNIDIGTLDHLTGLQTLHLSNNLLTNIDNGTLDHLTGLQTLNGIENGRLHENMISDALFIEYLPTTLYSLSLKNNSFGDIANGTFYRLFQLQNLLLVIKSGCCVEGRFGTQLNSQQVDRSAGRQVDMSAGRQVDRSAGRQVSKSTGRQISELLFVASLSNSLRTLSLNNNSIEVLPSNQFEELTRLQTLSLNNNSISSIQNGTFAGLTALQYLYLDGNSIPDIGFMRTLSYTIYKISLNRNALTELANGILEKFTNLNSLDLSSNRISHIQWDTFSTNMNLKVLNLNDNPISCGLTTAEIFLNFTLNEWLSIHNDIRYPHSCIHTPVHSRNYWNNIDDVTILYFTGCNGKRKHNFIN
ncbi:unnamed protein product [Mytilus edulis]|uniref:Uncharacterized protein n=1 Tax=Mytilus edulis TaxID=6550 RepID=A0A8S3V0I4_MYTED|nr:unnamed protein product [Mytilus edulis]